MIAKFLEAKDSKISDTLQQKILESLDALTVTPDLETNFTTAFNLKVAETTKIIGTLATEFSVWVVEMTGRDDT